MIETCIAILQAVAGVAFVGICLFAAYAVLFDPGESHDVDGML